MALTLMFHGFVQALFLRQVRAASDTRCVRVRDGQRDSDGREQEAIAESTQFACQQVLIPCRFEHQDDGSGDQEALGWRQSARERLSDAPRIAYAL